MAKQRDAFDVSLPDDSRRRIGLWVCDQIQDALNARGTQEIDVDYWWQLYEQARTRVGRNAPWPNAADLTSYLASEKVDALHARIMRTIWTEPVWTVEGWGPATEKAPLIEEFHQWKAEEERLQAVLDRLVLQSLVEPRGLLEISEGTEMRTVRKRLQAVVETDPMTGGPVFGMDGEPILQRDDRGQLVEAQTPDQLSAETVIDSTERVRTGPVYRLLPYRDSLILPGHARDTDEIYGYFKRFWRRLDTLQAKADAGVYDAEAIEKLGVASDREADPALQRSQMAIAPQERGQSEKELWEGVLLIDLAALCASLGLPKPAKELRGERWYLVTVHVPTNALLRIQHDDMERSRFVPVILFPRADRATEGLSFVGHKLITTIEEHTAWRNMAADRAAMVVQAPVKRLQGALWDPAEQPFGPTAVIDVRDMREIEPFAVPDVNAATFQHIQMMERTAERLAGINDVASGQVASENRTLGEVQMATEQSFVRMDLVVKRFQEAMEDVAQIRHAIWKRTLAENPDGYEAPLTLLHNLEGRGVSIDQYLPEKRITADLLEGAFRFKPRGSVESADPNRLRNDFVGLLQAIPALLQAFPMLQMMFASPQAARAMARQFLRVFKVENTQAFLGSPSQDLQTQGQLNLMPPPPAMPMMPGMAPMGGAPMGGPPMAGPPMPMGGEPGGFPPAA